MRYYTADLHLNSGNVIKWFHRKFPTVLKMNDVLINNINMRCKSIDTLIHVGDFAVVGNEKGVDNQRIHPNVHIGNINSNLILIKGNHDDSNRVKCHAEYIMTDIEDNSENVSEPNAITCMKTNMGKLIRNVSIGHYPSYSSHAAGQFVKNSVRICGHVHNAWKYYWDRKNDVLNINVGCDVWNYMPVSETDLIIYINKLQTMLKHTWNGCE